MLKPPLTSHSPEKHIYVPIKIVLDNKNKMFKKSIVRLVKV